MCSSTAKVVDDIEEELSGKFCETRVLILTHGSILISLCQEVRKERRFQTDKKQYVDLVGLKLIHNYDLFLHIVMFKIQS